MCGIAGIIGNFSKSPDKNTGENTIKSMLKVIEHRGPDSNGFWAKNNIAFGMQRLSIIDLAGGDQPIWDDTRVGIVFNGEIYNFKKLREDLEKTGVKFKSHSDTEVILQLYMKKGIDCISDLEGMFAICLYDPRINKVFLIRDRLGVKPLYYADNNNQFVFGSEIKSLLEVCPQKAEINQDSIWHYLTLRYSPAPETVWKGIKKLDPGHYMEINLEDISYTIHKYWSVDFRSEKKNKSRNYDKEFEILFLEAIEKRLLASDVPVGILLSGGLDSSSVAAAAVELGHKNFHTFSIGFEDGGRFSELQYAKKLADHIGSNHHEIIIGKSQFLDFIDDFVWYSDEPLADLASIPLYYVSKLASEHVKVVLSGEGADEVLAGYNMDQLAEKFFYLKILDKLPKQILRMLPKDSAKQLAESGYGGFPAHSAMHITNIFSEQEKRALFNFISEENTEEYIRSLYSNCPSPEPIDKIQQVYCHSWLVEDLLMKADKMSMATSLELRVPFLDHKLVEWAARLPLELKVGSRRQGFSSKNILRRFADSRIPREIITRPKEGFPVPAYQWLMTDLRYLADSSLDNLQKKQLINMDCASGLLHDLDRGSIAASHKLWNIIILEKWMNKWQNKMSFS